MSKKNFFHRGNKNSRKKDTRTIRPLILIVYEGEKTEYFYFNAFEVTNVNIIIAGTGRGAKGF